MENTRNRSDDVSAENQRRQVLQEYEIVVNLMRDTGEAIWLINTAYLIALPLLVWLFSELLLDASAGRL